MVQNAEENYGQTIAENVVENILNEVTRSITERTDSCFESFESLKLHTFGSEDILDYGCSKRENCGKSKENQVDVNVDFPVNDLCYPSLANLPEVCVHSPSLSKSSKQGEGDFQGPTIREAVAFYRLETGEENRPSGSKDHCASSALDEDFQKDAEQFDVAAQLKYPPETEEDEDCLSGSKACKNSCTSSFTSETSHDELIEDLQRTINDMSFDSVHLSYSEDGSHAMTSPGSNTPNNPCSREVDDCVCMFDAADFSDKQSCLHQSKKFCQFNKVHFFAHDEVPSNYCHLVDQSYGKYESVEREEDERTLLSDGSSEELVIIESDEIDQIPADNCYPQTNRFQSSCLSSATSSTMAFGRFPNPFPGPSSTPVEPLGERNRITVVAVVEPLKDRRNWEEALEVQVSVTEPITPTELDEECGSVKKKKYWTTVGLVTENIVDPKYAAFVNDDAGGIESTPGMSRVQETRLHRNRKEEEDEILTIDEATEREMTEKLNWDIERDASTMLEVTPKQDHGNVSSQSIGIKPKKRFDNVNYLNFSEDAERVNTKKKKFVSRLTRSFTNLFRLKKKIPK